MALHAPGANLWHRPAAPCHPGSNSCLLVPVRGPYCALPAPHPLHSYTRDRCFDCLVLSLHVHVHATAQPLPASLPACPARLRVPQVEDEGDIVEIQNAYDICGPVFSAPTGRLNDDHKTSMVGNAVIHTNPAAVAPG